MQIEVMNEMVEVGQFEPSVQAVLVAYSQMDVSTFEGYQLAQDFVYDQLADYDNIYDIELLLGF
jgi:hypothetical protein